MTENPDRVRKRVENRRLLCTLTPTELQNAGAKLAVLCEDIANEDKAQADIKAQLKAKLASLEAQRDVQAMIVRRKADYKEIPIDIFFNYTAAVVEEIRTDTGEVLLSRAMSDSERQMKLIHDDQQPDDPEPVPA